MIKSEFANQFKQTWKILKGLIDEFDDALWLESGTGYVVPARLAYHILLGVEYYIEYTLVTSEPLDREWRTMELSELPSRKTVLTYMAELSTALDAWLNNLDPDGENKGFPWAGPTNAGVVIFLLRHTMYHVGELNSLCYLGSNGSIDDMYMKGFK